MKYEFSISLKDFASCINNLQRPNQDQLKVTDIIIEANDVCEKKLKVFSMANLG